MMSVFENVRCGLMWSQDYKYSFWEDGVDIEGIDDRAITGVQLINDAAT